MDDSNPAMAQQIAEAASAYALRTTGHLPESVAVVVSDHTLVITLHGSLSPAERALAASPGGAEQVEEFHQQLFASASHSLRQEIKRITGAEVRDAESELVTQAGAMVKLFATGTVVHVFLLADRIAASAWSGNGRSNN